jgi:hypothetical protein
MDSVALLKSLLARFGARLRYVIVLNQLRGDSFELFEASAEKAQAHAFNAKIIALKRLNQEVIAKIDAEHANFWPRSRSRRRAAGSEYFSGSA